MTKKLPVFAIVYSTEDDYLVIESKVKYFDVEKMFYVTKHEPFQFVQPEFCTSLYLNLKAFTSECFDYKLIIHVL